MIKSEIRSLIKNELPKLDKSNKYHPRFIDAAIEKVLNGMYNDVFKRNPLELQRFTKQYGYTTALSILYEDSTGLYYVTHPAAIVPFPDRASGIRRISTMIQGGMTFYPIDAREADLVRSGSSVASVTAKIGYVVTRSRSEFYKMTGTIRAAGVRMDVIVPFSVYADTEVVLIPEVSDEQGETFVDKVLKILGVIREVDQKDNNADEIRKQNG